MRERNRNAYGVGYADAMRGNAYDRPYWCVAGSVLADEYRTGFKAGHDEHSAKRAAQRHP